MDAVAAGSSGVPDRANPDRANPGGANPGGAAGMWLQWWAEHARQLADGSPADRLAARQGFVLTREQALTHGVSAAEIRRDVYRGRWWAPRRGVLAVVAVPPGNDEPSVRLAARRRHALTSTAAALSNAGHRISGRSAAVLHGLPLFAPPGAPQLTAPPPNTPGHRAATLVRPAGLGADEVSTWFGAGVTTVQRTLVDLARHSRRDGVVAGDAALRELGLSRADVELALARAAGWPGVRRARDVLHHVSPLAESPLESVTRLACIDAGLPPLVLQAPIRDPELGRVYRVDGLWRAHRVILEMDGRAKYSGDELWQEKVRQDRLWLLGYRIVRVTWADVVRSWPATLARIQQTLAHAATGVVAASPTF